MSMATEEIIYQLESRKDFATDAQKEALNAAIKAVRRDDVLDKIRTEIEQLHHHPKLDFINTDKVVDMALEIIDKYKAESEERQ